MEKYALAMEKHLVQKEEKPWIPGGKRPLGWHDSLTKRNSLFRGKHISESSHVSLRKTRRMSSPQILL